MAAGVALAVPALAAKSAGAPAETSVAIYSGSSGEAQSWDDIYAAIDAADIIVVGEVHADPAGHAIQRDLIVAATRRWKNLTIGLEEFDRSQQSELASFARSEMSGAELEGVRDFVDPKVRKNWAAWYLPKLEAARDGGAMLLATNAPLQYSRMVRNLGCDNLPVLPKADLALFECPQAPEDPQYRARFDKRLQSVARFNKGSGLKPLATEQTEKMFRAHRVWDATMAGSIVQARAASDGKILHLVGNFHCDFNGGLIQELRYRDGDSRILVISLNPRRTKSLLESDRGRADFVIYTRS